MSINGRIHSIETCGTVDGPGVRFVVFTQGCPLRCQYCHNPDSWKLNDGKEIAVDKLMNEIKKYKSFMKFSSGGVTISGGEPLLQPHFVKEVLKKCKEEGIHTALDTSGYVDLETVKDILEYVDLVLLDIKSYNPIVYKELTGVPIDPTIKLAEYLSKINKPVYIRYVLVPTITDNAQDIDDLAKFIKSLNNVQKIELLPFHKMGEYKWESLNYDYKLRHVDEPTSEQINYAKEIFENYDLEIN